MEKAWQGAQQTQSEEELSPPSPSNTALKALTGARRQEKEGGESPTGKEIKAPLSADGTLHERSPFPSESPQE